MLNWTKAIPWDWTGFARFLVFGLFAKLKQRDQRGWLLPSAIIMAFIVLLGGLGLAYVQIRGASTVYASVSVIPFWYEATADCSCLAVLGWVVVAATAVALAIVLFCWITSSRRNRKLSFNSDVWQEICKKSQSLGKKLWPNSPICRFLALVVATILLVILRQFGKSWFTSDVNDGIDAFVIIAAILFAVQQFADAAQQKREIRDVVEEMSTQYIGTFPDNMKQIIDVIDNTKQELRIIVDFTAYGQYSAPKAFLDYFNSLTRIFQDETKKVRIISYRTSRMDRELAKQMPELPPRTNEGLTNLLAKIIPYFVESSNDKLEEEFSPDGSPSLRQLKENMNGKDSWVPRDEKELHQMLFKFDKLFADSLESRRDTPQKRELKNRFYMKRWTPFFIWVGDDRKAVFAFNNATENEREISFQTSDGRIIRELTKHFEGLWEKVKSEDNAKIRDDGPFVEEAESANHKAIG